jgi:hypothetical protein
LSLLGAFAGGLTVDKDGCCAENAREFHFDFATREFRDVDWVAHEEPPVELSISY